MKHKYQSLRAVFTMAIAIMTLICTIVISRFFAEGRVQAFVAQTQKPVTEVVNTVQPGLISEPTAVVHALSIAQTGSVSGYLDGVPDTIYGKVMSYEAALDYTTRGSIEDPSADRQKSTWVFVFQGTVVSYSDDTRIFRQTSVIIDAITAETLLITQYPPEQEIDISALAQINLPSPASTIEPIPTPPLYPPALPATVTLETAPFYTALPLPPHLQITPTADRHFPTVTPDPSFVPYPLPSQP